MAEATGVAVLVLGDTGVRHAARLVEESPEGVDRGVEGKVADEQGLSHTLQVSVIGLVGAGEAVLGLVLETLGLFDDEVAAHMLTSVLLESLVELVLGSDFHEAESAGSASRAVSDEFDIGHLAERAEKFVDVLLGRIVGKATDFDFIFLVGVISSLGSGSLKN